MTNTRTLQVAEIFRSIQGESTRAGLPCTFIRLVGCNLRCRWCDTSYAWEGGSSETLQALLNKVRELPAPLVELTGGEPLLQEGTVGLLTALLELARSKSSPLEEVMIETNGSLDIGTVPEGVRRIVDVKCPGSGMSGQMLMSNLDVLRATDEVKFVIADRADYDWARDLVRTDRRLERAGAIHFMPVMSAESPNVSGLRARDLADWILADRLNARLSLQLHKIIWGSDTRR